MHVISPFFRDKNRRMYEQEMETVWYSNKNLSQHLFTGVLYNQYSPPPGFCWDILCNDEPLVDDPESHSYNLDRRISSFISYVKDQANHFKTNNVALTMGMDFHYSVNIVALSNGIVRLILKNISTCPQNDIGKTFFLQGSSCMVHQPR